MTPSSETMVVAMRFLMGTPWVEGRACTMHCLISHDDRDRPISTCGTLWCVRARALPCVPMGLSASPLSHPVPSLVPALPRFAQIEPIGRCNLACRMCGVHDRGDEVGSLSLQRLRELLDAMPQLEQLHLQGLGEPMLHPDFFAMVELAASRGLRVSANTNLTLLTEARAERCVRCGLAALSVSIDGASAPVYEAIRRKASFAKVLRNLRRLTLARDRAGSALAIRGVMVLMRGNLHELPALVRLLHGHGVDELLVQRLANNPRGGEAPQRGAAREEGRRYVAIVNYVDDAELRSDDMAHAAHVFDDARSIAAE